MQAPEFRILGHRTNNVAQINIYQDRLEGNKGEVSRRKEIYEGGEGRSLACHSSHRPFLHDYGEINDPFSYGEEDERSKRKLFILICSSQE